MLVAEKHKRLILNLNDPGRVKTLVPGALDWNYKGHDLLVVPHTHDAAMALRGVGINAPAPINHYYHWPGRTPFQHQRETAAFLTLNPRAYCLNDMGTGKTLSALWAFDYLRSIGELEGMVVVTPLSTLERSWGDEIFRNFSHLDFAVLHGTAAKRQQQMARDVPVYLVNHDGVRSSDVSAFLEGLPPSWLVLIDEMSAFRNPGTQRWKALNRIVNGHRKSGLEGKRWAWALTGTPIPNAPTDVYGQCRVITPTTVPNHFGAFRDLVMLRRSQFVWTPKPDALPRAQSAMSPSIRFRREDCIDLPPTTYVDREVPLTPEQQALYTDMLTRMKASYDGGELTAINRAVMMNKLIQIVCGVAYGRDGEIVIPAEARITETLDIIEQSEGKVIVFAPLSGALRHLAAAINQHYTTEVITGETPRTRRDAVFADFQNATHPRVLVANPGTMAHGLTLTAASTIVWFGPAPSPEIYQQANMRIVRPGQTRNTLIVRLQGSAAERKRYASHDGCGAAQDLFLDTIAEVAL